MKHASNILFCMAVSFFTSVQAVESDMFIVDTRYTVMPCDMYDDTCISVMVSDVFECDTGAKWNDSDLDGIPDWWEKKYTATGSMVSLVADADEDGDGMRNYAEFVALTDPTDVTSRFDLSIRDGCEFIVVSWKSSLGRVYDVYVKNGLNSSWPDIPVATYDGTGFGCSHLQQKDSQTSFFCIKVRIPDE